jgi:hypothetical protein
LSEPANPDSALRTLALSKEENDARLAAAQACDSIAAARGWLAERGHHVAYSALRAWYARNGILLGRSAAWATAARLEAADALIGRLCSIMDGLSSEPTNAAAGLALGKVQAAIADYRVDAKGLVDRE